MKKTQTTIQPTTDKPNALDEKIFAALRLEVQEVTKILSEHGPSLSPRVLISAHERLAEVARFAATFEGHGIPANGVVISLGGAVLPVQPQDEGREARDARIYALRHATPPKTWRAIFDETGLTISQARDAAKRHERSLAKGKKA